MKPRLFQEPAKAHRSRLTIVLRVLTGEILWDVLGSHDSIAAGDEEGVGQPAFPRRRRRWLLPEDQVATLRI